MLVMNPKIKIDLEALIREGKKIVLELGCGPRKGDGRIGVDLLDLPNVDIVADVNAGLPYFPDGSVDEIHSRSLFEHVENLEFFMREVVRVLKKDGRCHVFVPHFSNPFYYSDYTHQKFFGLFTFYYFVPVKDQPRRQVPDFYTDIRIKIFSHQLIFQSTFRGVHFLKRLFGRWVNSSRWCQEFYEENLCYLIPCYAIETVFGRLEAEP